jgi:hypothetical protein
MDRTEFEKNYTTKCLEDCIPECHQTSYKITISSAQFPSSTYTEMILDYAREDNHNLTTFKKPEDSPKNLIVINAFYPTETYKLIADKESVALNAFISNFGGMYGLFSGGSLLSLCEIGELVIVCMIICFKKKKQNEK